jgi:hypothetical protein
VNPKLKTTKEQRVKAHSLARNTIKRVEGRARALGWD